MITFVVAGNQTTLQRVTELSKAAGGPRIRAVNYGTLFASRRIERSTYVFCDLEVLSDYALARSARIRQRIRENAPELVLLNDADKRVDRVTLAQKLFTEGINEYNVHSAYVAPGAFRFPVFLRHARDHAGPLSAILHDQEAYRNTLESLDTRSRSTDLIAVEYVDYADEEGWYVKYGCVVVGTSVWTSHVMRSRDWMIKRGTADASRASKAIDLEVLIKQPHQALLQGVTRTVGLEYGRLDYFIKNGRVQVFEMNTNPTFRIGIDAQDVPVGYRVIDRLLAAFRLHEYNGPAGTITVQSFSEAAGFEGQLLRVLHHGRAIKQKLSLGILGT